MPESQHPSTGCFSGSTPIDLMTVDELETRNAQPENDSKGNQSDAEDWDEGDLTYSGIPLNVHLSRAEETLSHLLNKCGVISGNKVQYSGTVMTYSPGDKMALQASRLGLSHWAGPSVTRSTSDSPASNGGIIVVILAHRREVHLVSE